MKNLIFCILITISAYLIIPPNTAPLKPNPACTATRFFKKQIYRRANHPVPVEFLVYRNSKGQLLYCHFKNLGGEWTYIGKETKEMVDSDYDLVFPH